MFKKSLLCVALAAATLSACSTTDAENRAAGAGTGGSIQPVASTGPAFGSTAGRDVAVGDRVLFEFDSAVIGDQFRGDVDSFAAWLRGNPAARVAIEGHADERGTREYNMALGDRRAVALRNALVDRGVATAQIVQTISYGKERPATVGSSESAWAQNRRAVMVPQ